MSYWTHLCNRDWCNEGWEISGATEMWAALNNDDDNKFCKSPGHRGGCTVAYPVDISTIPDGAVITSITVKIRASTGPGASSLPRHTPATLTVNLSATDDITKYTTRTIPLTSTPTTYELATYQRDALGLDWDIHRINHVLTKVFHYASIYDCVRIYKFFIEINYRVRPTLAIVNPTGTIFTPSPVISWLYTQANSDPQEHAEYKIFTAVQQAQTSFDPDTAPPVYAATVPGNQWTVTLPTSLDPDQYWVFIRVWSSFKAKSVWTGRFFTVQGPAPGVPGDDNAGIAGVPGVGMPTVVPDSFTSSTTLRMRDTSNLLSVNQADFEIVTDPIEYVGANATVARDTTTNFGTGVASMSVKSTAGGTMSATSTKVEVSPLSPVTVRAQIKSAVTARTTNVYLRCYDSTFTQLSNVMVATGTDSASTYTEFKGNATSPAVASGPVYAELVFEFLGTATNEVHNVDHVGLMYGTDTAWSDGGHSSPNLLTSFLSTGDDPAPTSDQWAPANVASTTQRVTATGTGAHGLKANQMTFVGASGTIARRSVGTVFTTPTTGVDYTLNKPAGVVDNDLLIAFVTSTESGGITPPSGWAVVNQATVDDSSTDVSLYVLKRTGLAADPSTWTSGFVAVASSRRSAVVVAYSGAASADDQFLADAVRTDTDGALIHHTQSVTNSDPNAWRVTAFAASDPVSGGAFTANISSPSTPAPISYVGSSSDFVDQSSNTSYTLNRPTGIVSGDLMVAGLVLSGKVNTVTPPTGWTLVRRTWKQATGGSNGDVHSGDVTACVFKRTATASEPNSWTGSHSDHGQPKVSRVVAYRNADTAANQFIAETAATATDGFSVGTGTVTNTDSKAWRLCMFAATTPYFDSWVAGADTAKRTDTSSSLSNFPDTSMAFFDSNSQISTGSHSRSGAIDTDDYFCAVGWIGIIKPLPSAPAQGAGENELVDNDNGSSGPWLNTAVYDSNGVIPAGATSVYGAHTVSSGTAVNAMASWIGIIKPATQVQAGLVGAYTSTMIDISALDPSVLPMAGNKMTLTATFLGSVPGTPIISLDFFRANQKISRATAVGNAFNTTTWVKSWATFDVPAGTTRIRPRVEATDRSISDTVQFDRVGVLLGAPAAGEEPMWRNGTARTEHPVWSKPVLQYADDPGTGYGPWTVLPGQQTVPPTYSPGSGILTYIDHSVIPLNNRKYRVQTLSYGLAGDVFASGFGSPSGEVSMTASNWWLKDIENLDLNMTLNVKADPVSVTTSNTASVFQPLGEDYPVVLTEGFKSDVFTLTLIPVNQDDFSNLKKLFKSGRTLFLQSDVDHAWWVRPAADIDASILATGQRSSKPYRELKLTFVQVAPID